MTEFEALLQAHFVPLQRYVHYKVADRQDAEDIIQEVCMTAAARFASLSHPSAFNA